MKARGGEEGDRSPLAAPPKADEGAAARRVRKAPWQLVHLAISARVMAVAMAVLVCAIIVAADFGLPLALRRMLALPLVDKLGHFALFGTLSWFVVQAAMQARPARPRAWVAAECSLWLVLLAAVEEFSQRYFRSRTFSLWDLAASGLGIVLMAMLQVRLSRGGDSSGQTGARGRPV